MITNDKFIYKGKFNKAFVIFIADNGFGKTKFLQNFVCRGVPRDKIFVLNTSLQKDWRNFIPNKNIFLPVSYSQDFIEQWIAEFASKYSDCLVILDDIDAYPIKHSDVVYKFIREARHSNIGVIAASGMLQKLPTIYYQQADYTFIGPQESKWNIRYIKQTNIPPEDAMVLMNLERYQFFVRAREDRKSYLVKLDLEAFK